MKAHRSLKRRPALAIPSAFGKARRSARAAAVARLGVEALEQRALLSGAPTVVNQSYITPPGVELDTTSTNGVLAGSTDPSGQPLTAIQVAPPADGTLTLNSSDGSFAYVPNNGFHGSDKFTFKANDGTQDSNVATATVIVDTAPQSFDVSGFQVAANHTLTQPTPGLLSDSFDPDGDPLTVALVAAPSHGAATVHADGSFTYTPTANYVGPDSFTFKANDGFLDGNAATVGITVTNPISVSDSFQSTFANKTLTVGAANGVLLFSTDLNTAGMPLTAAVDQKPAHGTLTLAADGSYTYVPTTGYLGSDSFTFKATDGTFTSADGTVSLDVANPVQTFGSFYQVFANTTLTTTSTNGVLANDSDGDGKPLTAAVDTPPADGKLTLAADGSFTYIPTSGFVGSDSFTYKASDGSFTSPSTQVQIAVNNPVSVVVKTFTTVTDKALTTTAATGVLAGATDADGGTLKATVATPPADGKLTLNIDGSFTYTPNAGFTGGDTVSFTAGDGTFSVTATDTINVNDPIAVAGLQETTLADKVLTVAKPGVLAGATDAYGTALTAAIATNATNGKVTLAADGSFTYTPNAKYIGPDNFTYTATDGKYTSNPGFVLIAVNSPAQVVAATFKTDINVKLVKTAAQGVLAGATDANGKPLTAAVVTNPTNGTLSLAADGSFTYTPTKDFQGSDFFTFKANDGTYDSAVTGITIDVINPVATQGDFYNVTGGVTFMQAKPGVLGNDSDADGKPLTAALDKGPTSGTLVLNGDGSFTYTPKTGFTGSDSFTYKASDGTYTSTETFVNLFVETPIPTPFRFFSTPVNTALTTTASDGVLQGATDATGGTLTAVLGAKPAHGTLTFNADGSFVYTPTTNYFGSDTFTFTATDGTYTSNTATAQLEVLSPATVVGQSYTTTIGQALTLGAPGVLAGASDSNGNPLTAAVVTNPSHGTLALAADGSFTYTPAAKYQGPDSFVYKANDGTFDSLPATVMISVNSPVVVKNQTYSTFVNVTVSTTAATGALAGATDSNTGGSPLTVTVIEGPSDGKLTLNAADGSFTYVPNKDFIGFDFFSVTASDGTFTSNPATISLQVNSPAQVQGGFFNLTAGTTLTEAKPGVLAGATDANGQPLKAIQVSPPSHGTLALNNDGSFVYTPTATYVGGDSFSFKANDGTYDSAVSSVFLNVTSPVTVRNNSYTTLRNTTLTVTAPGILTGAADANGKPITAIQVKKPAHGTLALAADGSFTYVPTTGYIGPDSFAFKGNDGSFDSQTTDITITVTGPVTVSDGFYSTAYNTTLSVGIPGVLLTAHDINHKAITATLGTKPAHGTLTLAADGSFSYVPKTNFHGQDSFTFTATDGTDTSLPATVRITVTGPVTVSNNEFFSTPVNTTLTEAKPGVLAGAHAVSGKPLTAGTVEKPFHGTLTLNADGSFSYVPNTNFIGFDDFSYTASDGTNLSDPGFVSLDVTSPVTVLPGTATVQENQVLTVAAPGVLAKATDSNGPKTLTASVVNPPQHGVLVLHADGSYTYTPTTGYFGHDNFEFKANDGTFDSSPSSVFLTVASPVVVVGFDGSTLVNQTLTTTAATGVLAGATDAGGKPLTAVQVTAPADGKLTLAANGSFTYVPNTNFIGEDSFTFKANDGTFDSLPSTAVIHVTSTVTAKDDSYTTTIGAKLTTTAATGVLANDTDVNTGKTLTAKLVDAPADGTLTLNTDGSFSYTPDPGFQGVDGFDYKANDGTFDSSLAFVTITVNGPVIAIDQTYTATIGTPLVIAAPGVLTGATDSNAGKTLTAIKGSDPFDGTLVLNANGSFTYTTPANVSDNQDFFTYTVTDGTNTSNSASVTINLLKPGAGPVVLDSSYATNENATLSVTAAASGVLAGATDNTPNAKPLKAIVVTKPANGTLTLNNDGTFTYVPNSNFSGTDTFTFKANDTIADSNTATVSITVNFVNAAPTIGPISDVNILENAAAQTVNLTGIANGPGDPAVETISVTATSDNHALLADPVVTYAGGATGSLAFTPVANASGTANVTVTVKNSGGTAHGGADTVTKTFKVNVGFVNQAPTIAAISDVNILENATAQTVNLAGISAGPGDPSTETVAITATSDNHALLADPVVTYTSGATGSLSFTPVANASGTANVTVKLKNTGGTASGGADTTTVTFKVNVGFVNQPPAIDTIAAVNILENASLQTVNLTGINAGPGDPSTETVTITATSNNHALLADPVVAYTTGATGTLTFTPLPNVNGPATITLTVKNSGGTANGGSDTTVRTFGVNVGFVNQPPTIDPISDVNILENAAAQNVNLTGLSTGPANQSAETLTVTATSDNHLLLADPTVTYAGGATGSLAFTPVTNASGVANVTVTVKNSGGTANGGHDTVTRSFKVNVGFVNQAPTFATIADVNILENAPAQTVNLVGISTGPGDPPAETLNITATSDNHALVADPIVTYTTGATGTLAFTPVALANGSANITVTAKNSGGTGNGGHDTTVKTFKVNVAFVNHPPTFTAGPNQSIRQASPAQTIPGWATAISPGPANQSSLTVNFLVTTDNPNLFAMPPAVSPTGALTYQATPHGVGTAHVSVSLQNSGGTANGGVDTSAAQTFTIQIKSATPGDFDGDGIADPAVLDTATATFFLSRSKDGNTAFQFGQGSKDGGNPINVSAGYEGNGRYDAAVFEPSTSTFFIHKSTGNVAIQVGQGTNAGGHPIPVPADYEGNGIVDPAIFEPSTATFVIHTSHGDQSLQFGQGTIYGGHPIPLPGNYDGNGIINPAVFEPSSATFFILSAAKGNRADQFGQGTIYGGHPVPVPANYDGDGTTDPAVFEPSTATFFIQSAAKGNRADQFGQGTLYGGHPVAVPGNYDGNGTINPAVFEPSTSTFFIQSTAKGNRALQFGQGTIFGGNPVVSPADFEGTGITDPAVFEPSTATFFIHTKAGNKAVQFGQGTAFGGHPVPITSPLSPTASGVVNTAAFGFVATSSTLAPAAVHSRPARSRRAVAHDLALEHLEGARRVVAQLAAESSSDRHNVNLHDAALGAIRASRTARKLW